MFYSNKAGYSYTQSGCRLFRYEVIGLRQSQYQSGNEGAPVRRSGSMFITVSYDRMSGFMRQISRMGGKIVNIYPINDETGAAPPLKPKSNSSRATSKVSMTGKSKEKDVSVNLSGEKDVEGAMVYDRASIFSMTAKYWIGVAAKDHVKAGEKGGFCQLRHGKQAPLERLSGGDWIVY